MWENGKERAVQEGTRNFLLQKAYRLCSLVSLHSNAGTAMSQFCNLNKFLEPSLLSPCYQLFSRASMYPLRGTHQST